MDLDKVTQAFLNIRDARQQARKAWEEEDRKLEATQSRLEAVMLDHLNKAGLDAARTSHATFYRQQNIKPSASDWNALYTWIKDNDAWDCLEKRIKKGFITEYQEMHEGGLPPGVSVYREYGVVVRRTS